MVFSQRGSTQSYPPIAKVKISIFPNISNSEKAHHNMDYNRIWKIKI